jgi:hypothetical protein
MICLCRELYFPLRLTTYASRLATKVCAMRYLSSVAEQTA